MVLSGDRASDFVLHFSLPMDPASVQDVQAYDLYDATDHWHWVSFQDWLLQGFPDGGGREESSSPVAIKTATYNPSTNTVDLHLAKSVDTRDVYQIGQGFVPDTTLLDAAGTPINEDGTGLGGGFTITLTNQKASIFDGVNQSVIPAAPRR